MKIISGGQIGADQGGILAAAKLCLETGGWMPKFFKTQEGSNEEFAQKYHLNEHKSPFYPPRTYQNVKESDGTIRFAHDFNSAGERCTLKAINQYQRPYIDVDILNPMPVEKVREWIKENKISVLNVAGNARGHDIQNFVIDYLVKVFEK